MFPAGVQIAGGSYLTVYATPSAAVPGTRLPDVLDPTHGEVSLTNAAGARIDGVNYGPQATGFSFGRTAGAWQLGSRTPGAANNPVATGSLSQLRLNEWLADPVPGEGDWLELSNSTQTIQSFSPACWSRRTANCIGSLRPRRLGRRARPALLRPRRPAAGRRPPDPSGFRDDPRSARRRWHGDRLAHVRGATTGGFTRPSA